MNSFLENAIFFINNYPHFKYLIMAIIAILQGEVAVILFVYLIFHRIITWVEFVIITLGSIILWENFIFLFGKIIRGSRFGWRIYKRLKEKKNVHIYFFYLKENLTRLILVSKFIPAVNIPFLFLIAWIKTKWSQFLKSYFISLILWFLIMVFVGYSLNSGLFYLKNNKIFKNIEIVIGLFIILIFILEAFIKKIIGNKIKLTQNFSKLGDVLEEFFKKEEN